LAAIALVSFSALRAILRAKLAFFSVVDSGLLVTLDGGEVGGELFFGLDLGGVLFFGIGFNGIGVALFFGTVFGEEGVGLEAAGVGVGIGVSFLLAVAGTTEGGEVVVVSGRWNFATGLPLA
jgi:hypothetical protein